MELHEEEFEKFQVLAIFYCPVLSCDKFVACVVKDSLVGKGMQSNPVFKIAARLKILYHKLSIREGNGK
ncbi:hypothetical protein A3E06_00395 [Candidatus Giovannonibacteria bacterium RIFCSPHIGHO2_12_FULL_44_42]|nr:MAG: hypothetical protein A3E06_00395 [Candidatus Giovannonibacteria bacterium RIFCSPHIGHO2_12_FULL_44_42]